MDPALSQVLALFDLHADEAKRYQDLLAAGELPANSDAIDQALLDSGLAELRPTGIAARSIRLALELRVASFNERFDTARRAAAALDAQLPRPTESVCEVIYGIHAVTQAFNVLQTGARTQVRSFDRGPYFRTDDQPALSPVQEEVTDSGVNYYTIVEQRALEDPATRKTVRDGQAMGEAVRVIDNLPLRLSIADDNLALLVLPRASEAPGQSPSDVDVLLVYPSAFLDGLISMFTSYWNLAVPLDLKGSEGTPDVDNQRFLQLLASGMTDSAIANELNVSARTVQRRLNLLQHRLGAASRFQLGVQAVRHGLLDGPED